MKAPTTSQGWRDLLDDFRQQAERIARSIAQAREQRKDVALGAVAGSSNDRQQANTLNRKLIELEAEQETIEIAQRQAQDGLEQAQADEELATEIRHVEKLVELAIQRQEAGELVHQRAQELKAALEHLHTVSHTLESALLPENESDARSVAGIASMTVTADWRDLHCRPVQPIGFAHIADDPDRIKEAAQQRIEWRKHNQRPAA